MNNTITLIWLALPFVAGFLVYLLPKYYSYLSLGGLLISISYPVWILTSEVDFTLRLLDNFGVTLYVDQLSGYFILTNCLVTIGVLIYCLSEERKAFFYTQLMILYGSVNACFIGYDFISFYVAIEVISIAAFLLMVYPRSDKSIWIGLRYLFVSNTAMLFYLIGAILIYKANNSFSFDGLINSPPEAIALILLGLLVKGGVFVSGLWLPLTHASVETPLSGLLSGIVVKAGIFPFLRLASISDEVDFVIRIVAIATAYLGVIQAIFENDTKRLLALSTVSQLGFIIASPMIAGFYALTHGLAKCTLFLTVGNLPSRDIKQLNQEGVNFYLWFVLFLGSSSIIGIPLLAGFSAKVMVMKNILSWQNIPFNLAVIGTAIALSKLIFLPTANTSISETGVKRGYWLGVSILMGGLIATNLIYPQTYTIVNISKALITFAIGALIYLFILKKITLKLPRTLEKFDNLIGIMSLTVIGLFWMVLPIG
ncbi:cation:proton antiporter [Cyanobacterium aponinum AL20118]|uniref:Cation:proton antiporter n=1 Tax=Cyanobacterium aponinum AL20115 TaxID=3090662 RepID=A0AAF1C5X9_9CHRO|nr:cation:proton antiporter [Cyanobacterium aponinum]WPF89801.1 cation:proton antiporter [Cyanobacterium aponinum AL20115]